MSIYIFFYVPRLARFALIASSEMCHRLWRVSFRFLLLLLIKCG